jgi:aquaporin Z
VLWNFSNYWIYIVGPIAGALLAVGIAYILRGRQSGIEAAQGRLQEIISENSDHPGGSAQHP